MSAIIFRQTIIMLILIFTGVLCAKTGIIGKEANRDLSKFVLEIVNPVVIFMAYQSEYRPSLAKNLLITFELSVASFAVMILLAYVLIRRKEGRETEIERFSLIYSNCGFMGIPLVSALFGDEGVFYLTAFITVFNIFVWTHGIILISGERSMKNIVKVLRSPTIISIALGLICFFARIRLPEIPAQALTFIKEINTPMAMIVSGVTMADTDILRLVKNPRVYIVCLFRLLVIPLAVVGMLSVFEISSKVMLTIIAAAAAPSAAMCTLHCIRFGKNSVYSSEIFTASTIFSVATLPLIVKIAELTQR